MIAQSLSVLGLDFNTTIPIESIFLTGDYREGLAKLLKRERLNAVKWEHIALAHHLIVAWQPATAHTWLNLVVPNLCVEEMHTRPEVHRGTLLGLLEAGVWLDKNSYQTEFQGMLLEKLAELICFGKPHTDDKGTSVISPTDFRKRLIEAVNAYLFPPVREKEAIIPLLVEEEIPLDSNQDDPLALDPSPEDLLNQRVQHYANALRYLHRELDEKRLSEWGELFIERLTHSFLARQKPLQKIAALCYIV